MRFKSWPLVIMDVEHAVAKVGWQDRKLLLREPVITEFCSSTRCSTA